MERTGPNGPTTRSATKASETDQSVTGGASTVTSYTYNNGNGTAAAGQPDTLTSSATTGGTTANSAWTYDSDGNTTSQSVTAGGR